MTWDATVTDTVAESYLNTTAIEAGAAAEAAARRKEDKSSQIVNTQQPHLHPLGV